VSVAGITRASVFRHAPTGKPRDMATKIQRIRRIGGIAIGAAKAIFRTGKAWGTTRTRVADVRRPEPTVPSGAALAAGAAGGAAGAYFLDPQNGKRRRQAAFGKATALVRRDGSEADEHVDGETAQMAAGNGAGAPAREKETAVAA
jgi:hypothetical protein